MAYHCGKNRFLAVIITAVILVTLMPSVLFVKAGAVVCVIGDTQYSSLGASINAVASGQSATIKIMREYTETVPVKIDGKDILFDLNGFNLSINTGEADDPALWVTNGGSANYTGSGTFRVTGSHGAVRAEGEGSFAAAGYAETTAECANCVLAETEAEITINGDVVCRQAGGVAIYAMTGGDITVNGNIQCFGDNGDGLVIAAKSTATVAGNVTVATDGEGGVGVNANNGGRATITGNIITTETGVTVYGMSPSAVTVDGDVTVNGSGSVGVGEGGYGNVTVTGNVTARGVGAHGVDANSGTVTVGGNVESDDTGAYVNNGGIVKIDGNLTAPTYVVLQGTVKGKTEYNEIVDDYRQYALGGNIVLVKVIAEPLTRQLTFFTDDLTVSAVIADLPAGSYKAYRGDTLLGAAELVGTGCVIKKMDGDTVVELLTVIVMGDVNGDGKVEAKDARAVLRHAVKIALLSGDYLLAGDVVGGDGEPTVDDARKVLRVAAGIALLSPLD